MTDADTRPVMRVVKVPVIPELGDAMVKAQAALDAEYAKLDPAVRALVKAHDAKVVAAMTDALLYGSSPPDP